MRYLNKVPVEKRVWNLIQKFAYFALVLLVYNSGYCSNPSWHFSDRFLAEMMLLDFSFEVYTPTKINLKPKYFPLTTRGKVNLNFNEIDFTTPVLYINWTKLIFKTLKFTNTLLPASSTHPFLLGSYLQSFIDKIFGGVCNPLSFASFSEFWPLC